MEGKPYQFMSRDEARAAGIPVPPDAVGVRIYGATVAEPQLPADADELAREMWEATDEPIHLWFGLSYASFFVMPRTVLQSMPVAWQAKFVALMKETHERFPGWEPPWPQGWTVHLRGEGGRYVADDLARYERGRRRLEPGKPARAGVDSWPDGGATP